MSQAPGMGSALGSGFKLCLSEEKSKRLLSIPCAKGLNLGQQSLLSTSQVVTILDSGQVLNSEACAPPRE